jgi:hypothetical protein
VDRLVEKLQTVIRVVKDVDIFVISAGDGTMIGTPFDPQINAAWREKIFDVRDGKRPLITTLSARNGQITNWSVTMAGERIRLVERPAATVVAPTRATNAPAKTAGSTSPPPSAIIIEKPRAAASSPDLPSSSAAAAPATPVVPQISVAPPTPSFAAPTPKIESTAPATASEASSPPAQRSVETSASVTNKLSTALPQAESTPAPTPPRLVPEPPVENSGPERVAPASDPIPASINPLAPMPVAAREPSPAIRNPPPQPLVAAEMVAVAVEPRSIFSPVTMTIIGSTLLLMTLALILLFVRRATPVARPSFITQSIERAQRQQ